MTLTAKQREVIERMANHERLSIRPSWGLHGWSDTTGSSRNL